MSHVALPAIDFVEAFDVNKQFTKTSYKKIILKLNCLLYRLAVGNIWSFQSI